MNVFRNGISWLKGRPVARLVLFALMVLLVNYAANHVFYQSFYRGFIDFYARLNELLSNSLGFKISESVPFTGFSIIFSAFLNLYFVLFLVLILLPLVIWPRKAFSWSMSDWKKGDQLFVATVVLILVWDLATYAHNYYVDRSHYLDRIMLIVFGVLAIRNLRFLPVFLVISLLIYSQFSYPVDSITTVDKKLLFNLLILLYSYILIKPLFPDLKTPYLFFAFCMIASAYFVPGLAKALNGEYFAISWIKNNDLASVLRNGYFKGWLSIDPFNEMLESIHRLEKYALPLKIFTLAFELLALFTLMRKKLMYLVIILAFLFHVGFLALSGVFFWKWMLVDIAVIYLIYKLPKDFEQQLFNRKTFVLSVAIIATSFFWFNPHHLAWYGSRLHYLFSYEIIDEQGRGYALKRNDMAPFDMQFQVDRIKYLVDEPMMKISGMSYMASEQKSQMLIAATMQNVGDLEARLGINHFDANARDNYTELVSKYFANRNNTPKRNVLNYLAPPRHFINEPRGQAWNGTVRVKKLRVYLERIFYDGYAMNTLDKTMVHEIFIP